MKPDPCSRIHVTMLKHRNPRPPLPTSRRRRHSHLHQSTTSAAIRPVVVANDRPEVALVPGTRFILFPLKKVTALVRPYTSCREPSATKTKPCIVSKPNRQGAHQIVREGLLRECCVRSDAEAHSKRWRAKQRRRRNLQVVAKTRLSPVCEGATLVVEQEVLQLEYESWLWNDRRLVEMKRARRWGDSDTSVFSISERPLRGSYREASGAAFSTQQMLQDLTLNTTTAKLMKKKRSSSFSHISDIDSILYRSSRKTLFSGSISTERECIVRGARSFGRNNRVSPSSLSHRQHPELRTGNDCTTSLDELEPTWNESRHNSGGYCTTSFGKAAEVVELCEKDRRHFRGNRRAVFDKADEVETLCNTNISHCRGYSTSSLDKADEVEILCNTNISHCRGYSTSSFDKADEVVTLCDKDRSHFRGNYMTTSFNQADEVVTLCAKHGSNLRSNYSITRSCESDELAAGSDKNRSNFTVKADELAKLCDENRRKSRGTRRTSFGKADEMRMMRENKRRSFSLGGCLHQIRSRSPFLCSFTNQNDLPVGPVPLQLSRRLQSKVSVAQVEI